VAEVFFDVPLELPDEWRTLLEREVAVLHEHVQAAAQIVGGLRRLHEELRTLSARHAETDRRIGDTPMPTMPDAVDTLACLTRAHEASHANLVAARQELRRLVRDLLVDLEEG
jgi:hypothetical protein